MEGDNSPIYSWNWNETTELNEFIKQKNLEYQENSFVGIVKPKLEAMLNRSSKDAQAKIPICLLNNLFQFKTKKIILSENNQQIMRL